MKALILSVLGLAASVGVVAAQVPAAEVAKSTLPEITTGGRGDVRVPPNKAVLVVTVEGRAQSATEAAQIAAKTVASVTAALRGAGAQPAQVTNGGYNVTRDYETERGSRKPRGFIARNSVRTEVSDIANLGRFIDASLTGGATEVSPIVLLGPNMTGARREALKLAVEEARLDADALATAAGGSLGRLISITTSMQQPVFSSYAQLQSVVVTGAMSSTGGDPTSIAPSDLIVSAVVNAKWEFLPGR